jgi:hypothetical protein
LINLVVNFFGQGKFRTQRTKERTGLTPLPSPHPLPWTHIIALSDGRIFIGVFTGLGAVARSRVPQFLVQQLLDFIEIEGREPEPVRGGEGRD